MFVFSFKKKPSFLTLCTNHLCQKTQCTMTENNKKIITAGGKSEAFQQLITRLGNERLSLSFAEFQQTLKEMTTKEQSAACFCVLTTVKPPGDLEKQVMREMFKIQHVVDPDDPYNLWASNLICFWMHPPHVFRRDWRFRGGRRYYPAHMLMKYLNRVYIVAQAARIPFTPATVPHLCEWLELLFSEDGALSSAWPSWHNVLKKHKMRLQKIQELLEQVLPPRCRPAHRDAIFVRTCLLRRWQQRRFISLLLEKQNKLSV